MAASIDWATIGRLVWAAPVAGIAVALSFSILVVGVTRAGEARRDSATARAAMFSVLAFVAAAAFAAVVVYGIALIVNKS